MVVAEGKQMDGKAGRIGQSWVGEGGGQVLGRGGVGKERKVR